MKSLLPAMRAVALAATIGVHAASCAEPGLTLTISGPDRAVKAGSEVKLNLALRNSTDHQIRLVTVDLSDAVRWAEIHYRATVKDGKGNAVPYTKYGTAVWGSKVSGFDGSTSALDIQPGVVWRHELVVSRLFDLSRPGVYVIKVARLNFEGAHDADVESNTITVAVTE